MVAPPATLKKAILFFDEIHFMDRPSFMFGPFRAGEQFGTVGCASPLRQVEAAFRAEGVPLFVHSPASGPVVGEFYEQVKADVNDPLFLARFQEGLINSGLFRDLQIAHGSYGQFGTHEHVAQKMFAVDLPSVLKDYEFAMNLIEDSAVRPFDLSTSLGCAKELLSKALTCSAKMNFALGISIAQGFVPLADASPYGSLLGAKYVRAIRALESKKHPVQITDLAFGVFDELALSERLEEMTFKEAVDYRKASASPREEFLEHLALIHAKQAGVGSEGDYVGAIRHLIAADIIPAVHTFKNKMQAIYESLYGSLAKGIFGAAGSSATLNFFGGLSWEKLIVLAGLTGAYIANAGIDALVAERAARRECSISYLLSLDQSS
jgi:hypothetical protein